MQPVNILYLLYCLRPAGAEKVVLSLARNLDPDKFRPRIATFQGGDLQNVFHDAGIPVHILDKKKRFDPLLLQKLIRILHEEKIQILHSHNFSANLWGRVAGYLGRVPYLVTTEHTVAYRKSAVQKWLDRFLATITHRIIAVSSAVEHSLIDAENLSTAKIQTIYNGIAPFPPERVDTESYKKDFYRRFEIPEHQKLAITIGRLEPPKGHALLLRAIAEIANVRPDLTFLFVGDGPLRKELKARASDTGITDRVVFTGFRHDIGALLDISDLCVVPSLREGFSITILEAMARAKPIIATDVGGNREAITHGVSGVIIPPNDSPALTKAILALIENSEQASQMGRKALLRFQELFTLRRMLEETERVYEELIGTTA